MIKEIENILKKYKIDYYDKVEYTTNYIQSNSPAIIIYLEADSGTLIIRDTELEIKDTNTLFDTELQAILKIQRLLK